MSGHAPTRDSLRVETERPWLPVLSALPLALVLPVVALAATVSPWMVVALLFAAAIVYHQPDSARGTAAIALTAAVWVLAGPDATSAWSLVVALLLLASHSVLALRATAPPTVEFDADILSRWLSRAGVIAGITAVVWLAAVGADRLPRSSAAAAVAIGLALVAGLALLLRQETVRGADRADR